MGSPTTSAYTSLVLRMFSHSRYSIAFLALAELVHTLYSSPVGTRSFGRRAHCFFTQYVPLLSVFVSHFSISSGCCFQLLIEKQHVFEGVIGD